MNSSNVSLTASPAYLSKQAKFWLLLVFLVPSIFCSFFVLFFLLFNRTLRHALNNHVIIIVVLISLVCQVTNYPWMLYFYQYQGTWERSLLFCEIWGYLDWGVYITQTILFAWATIERHILIFHDNWVSTKRRRLLFHYVPLIGLLCYCLIFYLILTFFPPCANETTNGYVCLDSCFYQFKVLYLWETVVHLIIPNIIIVVVSLALLVRVIWQKFRLHRAVHWRKHRKMAVQLLSISLLYLSLSFPLAVIYLIQLIQPTFKVDRVLFDAANYIGYFIMLLLPFVCVLAFSELRRKVNQIFHPRGNQTVGPMTLAMNTIQNPITQRF